MTARETTITVTLTESQSVYLSQLVHGKIDSIKDDDAYNGSDAKDQFRGRYEAVLHGLARAIGQGVRS